MIYNAVRGAKGARSTCLALRPSIAKLWGDIVTEFGGFKKWMSLDAGAFGCGSYARRSPREIGRQGDVGVGLAEGGWLVVAIILVDMGVEGRSGGLRTKSRRRRNAHSTFEWQYLCAENRFGAVGFAEVGE